MMSQVSHWIARFSESWSFASDTFRMFLATVFASVTQMVLVFLLVDTANWLPDEVRSTPVDMFIWYFLFCLYYVVLCQTTFGKLTSEELRTSLKRTKPKTRGPLWAFIYGESGTSHATMFSFFALAGVGFVAVGTGGDVDDGSGRYETIVYATALLTVVGSWISNVSSFALQYAREDAEGGQRGFKFPGYAEPVWSDYVYTAAMVSASLTTADVTVMTRSRRKLVTINTIIAFTFNTVIIAMLIAAIM